MADAGAKSACEYDGGRAKGGGVYHERMVGEGVFLAE